MALMNNRAVSVNHAAATNNPNLLTAGEAAAQLRRKGIKATAKELVEVNNHLYGRTEWHHSGFVPGRKAMGKTYFVNVCNLEEIAEKYEATVAAIAAKEEAARLKEEERKAAVAAEMAANNYVGWLTWEFAGKVRGRWEKRALVTTVEPCGDRNCGQLTASQAERVKKETWRRWKGWDTPSPSDFN